VNLHRSRYTYIHVHVDTRISRVSKVRFLQSEILKSTLDSIGVYPVNLHSKHKRALTLEPPVFLPPVFLALVFLPPVFLAPVVLPRLFLPPVFLPPVFLAGPSTP